MTLSSTACVLYFAEVQVTKTDQKIKKTAYTFIAFTKPDTVPLQIPPSR